MSPDQPPAPPILSDVCRWCLTCAYGTCRRFGHWELRMAEYKRDLELWQETQTKTGPAEKPRPVEPDSKREKPRAARSAMVVVLPPGVREYLASLGRRGGSSRSERKREASRRNGHLAGRRREV